MFRKISFFIGLVIFLMLASPAVAQEPVDPEHNDNPNGQTYDSLDGTSTPSPFTSPMGYATVSKLNVRSGPDLIYGVKGWITGGQPVLFLGRNGAATWLQVEAISGIEGWVYARYMHSNVPISELLVVHEPPTPTPSGSVGYVTSRRLHIRSGPGLHYPIVSWTYKDEPLTLFGRNSASTWLKVETRRGMEGWASAFYIYTNFPVTDLPVLQTPPTPTPTNPAGQVTVYRLNLRSGPGFHYSIIGQLYRRQPVVLLGRNNSATWLKLETRSGFEGWVSARYIRSDITIIELPVLDDLPTPPPNPIGYVTIYTLNIRSGPGLNYDIMGRLYRGRSVVLIGRNSAATWLKVGEARIGSEGWVFANYIRSNIPIMDLPVVQ